jgi:hypothetical protein
MQVGSGLPSLYFCAMLSLNNILMKRRTAETADSRFVLMEWLVSVISLILFKKLKNMSIAILKLTTKTVSYIVDKVREVVTGMTGNATYATPNPTLASISTQATTLETAFQDGINGGKIQKATVRAERKKMLAMMSLLTAYVQNASGGDEIKIRSANFDVKKTPSKPGILNPPQNVRASYGQHPGEILVRWDAVPKKRFYRVQKSSDPFTADSWTDLPNGETGKLKFKVSGLDTGKFHWFRVFTLSTEGVSGPSDAAKQMAP